jgi:DtxR family Mn-dependent transcriptional regulator
MHAIAKVKLTASLEDYLEAILFLARRGKPARVRDIARHIGVGMPSVTAAIKTLSGRGLVEHDPYEAVTLTERGRDLAEEVGRRHMLLRRFLTDMLGLEAESAEANACRMEHAVDDALLDRLVRFAELFQGCPRVGADWAERLASECGQGRDPQQCRACMSGASDAMDQARPIDRGDASFSAD